MTREEVKAILPDISDEGLTKIMTAHGKSIQAEQAKKGGKTDEDVAKAVEAATSKLAAEHKAALEGANAQISTLIGQKAELEKAIKEAPNLDEAVAKAVAEMEINHKTALKELEKSSAAELATLKRDSETADFLRSLDKKFATPETETIFRQRLNEALQDKAYEGKNRADIFAELVKGADGKERTDVFSPTTSVGGAVGGHGTPPPPTGQEFKFDFAGIRGRGEPNTD